MIQCKLTLQLLEQHVRHLAKSRPSTVYLSDHCSYVSGRCSDGTVGCIIGQAIRQLDPDFEFPETIRDAEVSDLLDYLKLPDSKWLGIVQIGQDQGLSWRQAVNNADYLVDEPS